MPTAVLAAMAALQMIGGGEDDSAQFIVVEVRRVGGCGDFLADQRENLRRVIQIASMTGQRGEAAATETGRSERAFSQETQDTRRHETLPAPARALVKAAFGDATAVRLAAQRTLHCGIRMFTRWARRTERGRCFDVNRFRSLCALCVLCVRNPVHQLSAPPV